MMKTMKLTFDEIDSAFQNKIKSLVENFNPEKFGEAIKRLYYVQLKYEKY